MRVSVVAVIVAFALTTVAVPGANVAQGCKPDKCRNAVSVGPLNNPTASASAKKDCSSFLLTTISPCPSTTTTKSTVTRYASRVTTSTTKTITSPLCRTETVSTTLTAEVKQYETITSTDTTTETATVTDVSTQTNVRTVTLPSTSTIEERETSKKLVVITPTAPPAETTVTTGTTTTKIVAIVTRGPTAVPNPRRPRAVPKCSPRTMTASKLPAYASPSCTSSSAYASACLCGGATRRTTTLPTLIVTACSTVIANRTPTRTVEVLLTQPGTCIETVTHTANEDRLTTVTETKKETATVQATTTVSTTQQVDKEETTYTFAGSTTTTKTVVEEVLSTACPLKQLSGPNSDINHRLKQGGPYDPAFWTQNLNQGANWYLDLDGFLRTSGGRAYFYEPYSGIYDQGANQPDQYQRLLRCSFVSDVLQCAQENGTPRNFYGVPFSKQYLFFGDGSSDSNLRLVTIGHACPEAQATATVTTTQTMEATATACPLKQVSTSEYGDAGSLDGTYLNGGAGSSAYWLNSEGSDLVWYLNGDSLLTSTSGLYLTSSDTLTVPMYLQPVASYEPEQFNDWAIKCTILATQQLQCVTTGPGQNNEFLRPRFNSKSLYWGRAGQQSSSHQAITVVRDCGDESDGGEND